MFTIQKGLFPLIALSSFFVTLSSTPAFADYRTDATVNINIGNPKTGSPTTNIPPSQDNCAGKLGNAGVDFTSYAAAMSLTTTHVNFGDPNCDFKKNDLQTLINQLETNPNRQKCYFLILAPYESGYNANAFLRASTSGNGAYGLFQMNPGSAGGQAGYDVGDVYWKVQTYNAITRNQKLLNNNFKYWDPRTLAHDTQGWCK